MDRDIKGTLLSAPEDREFWRTMIAHGLKEYGTKKKQNRRV